MANMRPTQARFPHPKSRIWTWQHPSNRDKDEGNRAQLDHILINGKWINSVENTRAYNTVECGSDHRIVSARIKIKPRVERQNRCIRTKFEWEKLKTSQELQAQFNVAVRNRFDALYEENEVNNLQTKYDNFERSMEETASKLLGKLRKPKVKHWVSKATTSILEKRNWAKKAFKSSRLERDKEIWQNLNQELESAYANDQVQHLEGKLQQLKSAAASGHLKATWRSSTNLAGKNMSKHQHKMKRADGSSINNKRELRDEWINYFRDLLNVHSNLLNADSILPAPSDMDINVGPISV